MVSLKHEHCVYPDAHCAQPLLRGVYSDTTQLNSTDP